MGNRGRRGQPVGRSVADKRQLFLSTTATRRPVRVRTLHGACFSEGTEQTTRWPRRQAMSGKQLAAGCGSAQQARWLPEESCAGVDERLVLVGWVHLGGCHSAHSRVEAGGAARRSVLDFLEQVATRWWTAVASMLDRQAWVSRVRYLRVVYGTVAL